MVHSTQLHSAYSSKCKCYQFEPVFSPVVAYLQKADVTIGNLETTLPGDAKLFAGYPQFGAPDSLAEALKKSGFDILTTSNNHSCDNGSKGMEGTLNTLDKNGIRHLGTYRKKEYAKQRIFVIEKNGIKIAFLSYTYGTNGIRIPKKYTVNLIDKKLIQQDIQLARKQSVDLIMVYFHFGAEYLRLPDKFQKETVDYTIKQGADIILGGHPHVLQPYFLKIRKGVKSKQQVVGIYSLGNFVSGQHRRYTGGGMIFNFTVEKKQIIDNEKQTVYYKFLNIDYIPTWVHRDRSKGRLQYYVLPVEDYLKNDQSIRLTKYDLKRMKQFYKDTKTHMEKYSILEKVEVQLSQK